MSAEEIQEEKWDLQGNDEATVDIKGRIMLSTRKKERMGDEIVLCLGDSGFLAAYPTRVWNALMEKVRSKDPMNEGRQTYVREVIGTAVDGVKVDKERRFVIPKDLRTAAKIQSEVMIIGCLDRLEIWAMEEYEEYKKDRKNYAKNRKEMLREAWLDMMHNG